MLPIIQKGGPIMWPLMLTSIISIAVVLERLWFILSVSAKRQPKVVETILTAAERGDIAGAIEAGEKSQDYVAMTLVYGLQQPENMANALLRAANQALKHFNHGLSILDTVITLAPLLGLLGTVTGMIHAFGLLGGRELDAPSVITGGIAEALIATAFGLSIAVVALIPFNYLNARLEEARHEIQDAATHLELLMKPKVLV
jgi:biopolymer transport protein ExbB